MDYNEFLKSLGIGPGTAKPMAPPGGGYPVDDGSYGSGGMQTAIPQGGGGWGQQVGDFIKSPGGSAIISGTMSGIGAMGQAKTAERMNAQQLAMQQAIMGQNANQSLMNDSLTRDTMLNQSAPLGWAQGYEQQQMLRNMALDKLMNYKAPMPTNSDVLAKLQAMNYQPYKPAIPDSWQGVDPFGSGQTMEALANRQGVLDKISGGKAPGLDFTKFGLPEARGQQLNDTTGAYRQFAADDYAQTTNPLRNAININSNGSNAQQVLNGGGGAASGGGGGLGKAVGLGMTGLGIANGMGAFGNGAVSKGIGMATGSMGGGGGIGSIMGGGGTGSVMNAQGAGGMAKNFLGMNSGGATGMMGAGNMAAGPIGIGAGIAANYLPQGAAQGAARGFSTGAQIGSMVPGVGTLIGGGIGAAYGAIRGSQNLAKEDRDKFAKKLGYGDVTKLNQVLQNMGPQGQQLAEMGLNKIGQHDSQGNAQWMGLVQQFLQSQQGMNNPNGGLQPGNLQQAIGGGNQAPVNPYIRQSNPVQRSY